MKKLLYGALTLVFALVLTGCGNREKVVCEQKSTSYTTQLVTEVEKDTIRGMSMKMEMDLSAYSDAQMEQVAKQDFCTLVKSYLSTYSEALENCKQDVSRKILTITSDINVNKITDQELQLNKTSKEVKEYFEKQGYTCEIK